MARRTSPRCSLSLAHTTKDQQEASPIKAEKHDHFINGIPEEEEEEVDEEVDPEVTEGDNENNDSLNKKGAYFISDSLFYESVLKRYRSAVSKQEYKDSFTLRFTES